MKSILILLTISFMATSGIPTLIDIKESISKMLALTDRGDPTEDTKNVDAQIAILLDTSGSMSGLIEQAKSQLWNIVNELSEAKKDNEPINFQIALYEYGNDNASLLNSYVHQIVDFTSDIDLISQKLFSLSTDGGQEYCGAAIEKSMNQLNWNTLANLKTIYIAGNESFAQGRTSYKDACNHAVDKQVIVNTIFCGPMETGIDLEWRNGAMLTDGSYFNIDHNQTTKYYDSPYDDEISKLNNMLNKTYIHFGEKGKDFLDNQIQQDVNAKSYGRSNYASRSIFKSNTQYKNTQWDLVDAYEKDKNIIEEVNHLPAPYQKLEKNELELEVQKMADERKSIQSQIGKLASQRKKYIANLKKKDDQISTLDKSINTSLRKQAIKAGLHYNVESDKKAIVDYSGFLQSTRDLQEYRKERLINSTRFNEMSQDKNTIILDTRSKKAFDERHIKGAIHLNFSDFTEEKLRNLIPDKNSRILIYCNNNFISSSPALVLKAPPLALNIPTFINLHGYGYKNIYELESLIKDDEKTIKMSHHKK